MHCACIANSPSCLGLLLNAGALPDARGAQRTTGLMIAATYEYDSIIKRLVASGADVELRDNNGATALNLACWENRVSCLALLLDAGALPNTRTYQGWTPLMVAAHKRLTNCLRMLLVRVDGRALDLDATCNWRQQTALHYAVQVQNSHCPEIVSLLLEADANPTIRNSHGETPLDMACAR